jgi:hypothetical protein
MAGLIRFGRQAEKSKANGGQGDGSRQIGILWSQFLDNRANDH